MLLETKKFIGNSDSRFCDANSHLEFVPNPAPFVTRETKRNEAEKVQLDPITAVIRAQQKMGKLGWNIVVTEAVADALEKSLCGYVERFGRLTTVHITTASEYEEYTKVKERLSNSRELNQLSLAFQRELQAV